MPLNTTERQRQLQLAQDFAAKIKLERQFTIDLRRFFKELNQDFVNEFARNGRIINTLDFRPELIGVLRRHYRRAINRFGDTLRSEPQAFKALRHVKQVNVANSREELHQKQDEQTNEEVAVLLGASLAINSALTTFMREETDRRSVIVLDTTQNQLNRLVTNSFEEIEQQQGEASNDAVAESSGLAFAFLIPSKALLISATEIQNAAEGSKQIELSGLIDSGTVDVDVTTKQWNSILDERTRLSHASADGQVRQTNEPFLVQGQLLNRPGDTSLGATPSNIIRCRCSSITIID